MKKVISLIMVLLIVVSAFAGCSSNKEQESTTESTYPWENENWNQTEANTNNFFDEQTSNQDFQEQNTVVDNNYNNNYNNDNNNNYNHNDISQTNPVVPDYNNNQNIVNTTQSSSSVTGNNGSGSSGNGIISDENMSKLENSQAEVYFSDNPNNKGIAAISQRYGVASENLVALIKVNAEFPTITVLEFSGARDANGELVMTYNELVNVYEINETTGKVVKASKSGMGNDGLSFIEAKVYIALAKEYFIPELPNLKANKRYD
jgi:hypothetical protein